MSVRVDLDELAAHVATYGLAYLLTVTDDQRAHAVAVHPSVSDDGVAVDGIGGRTLANLDARPDVSLVWPPVEEGGYTLIVDGRATTTERGVAIAPRHAVLHRPADHAPDGRPSDTTSCGNDCVPLGDG